MAGTILAGSSQFSTVAACVAHQLCVCLLLLVSSGQRAQGGGDLQRQALHRQGGPGDLNQHQQYTFAGWPNADQQLIAHAGLVAAAA